MAPAAAPQHAAAPAAPRIAGPPPPSECADAFPSLRPSASDAAPRTEPESSRRLSGPLSGAASGDERQEEARRFARLLISEIKLYNERAVLEGREHGNLYERLREDIDRSRQMYDERIPEDVRSGTNFFYEELVQILADGRAEALGI